MKLSLEQQAAVYTTSNKVLVCAQAGSGKTASLTERVRYLLSSGVKPEKIVCITYTNMAAEEMKQRLGNSFNGSYIGTIHGYANYILLSNGIDTSSVIEEEDFNKLFTLIKNSFVTIPKVEHLLVDEFQDICADEYEFIMDIIRPKNYWFVGDSRQAIYSFKGSNYKYFMDLTKNPFVDIYELNNCYRCTPEIMDFANNRIRYVKDIYRTAINCIKPYGNEDVYESEFSFDYIKNLVLSINDFKNTTILCRSNKLVDDMCFYFDQQKIPYATFKKAEKTYEELKQSMEENNVKILTIHSAKGLEWDNVIVCQEYNAWNDEEKRINYVAATRARERLVWLRPQRKKKVQPKKIKMESWD